MLDYLGEVELGVDKRTLRLAVLDYHVGETSMNSRIMKVMVNTS